MAALMKSEVWSLADIPDQTGRTVVITGPSVGGLGHYTALELARRGARVVLAGRTPAKLDETQVALLAELPAANVDQLMVDLSDLASVRRAGANAAAFGAIDLLVNNAGIMGTRGRRTADGLDLQLSTNHFGPFLLTGLLLPQLVASGAGRVVSVSSQFHRIARKAPLGDPQQAPRVNRKWLTYGRSKLANLLFVAELDRRCQEAGLPVKALAAHPGFAGTHLAANGQYGRASGGVASVLDGAIRAVSQPAAMGAWPSLMAATAELPGGTYCGPRGPAEFGGHPHITVGTKLSRNENTSRELWELSQRATDITYP